MTDIDESLLPGILQEIAKLIGLPAMLKLVEEYGGVRLYVPKYLPPEHPLITLIGGEAAGKLSCQFGGVDHFDIPKAYASSVALRNALICKEYPELSQRKLALKYKLTERRVRSILRARPEDDRQMSLFDWDNVENEF